MTLVSRTANGARSLFYSLREQSQDYFASDHSDPRPLASRQDALDADYVVSCYDNWTDFRHGDWGNLVNAARRCTPSGKCVWDGVAFVRGQHDIADWHLILNNIDWHRKSVTFRQSPNRVMFAICEPPTDLHRPWHFGQGQGSVVLTCDHEAVRNGASERDYVAEASLTPSWTVGKSYDELKQSELPKKTRNLSWICSNESLLKGHRDRLAFLTAAKDALDFDHYGRGFTPIADKWGGLAPYRYSIAYENCLAELYFTEKVTDCFVAGTMPFYVGSLALEQYFPKESYVAIDPDDPDVFKIIADNIANGQWEKNREAILEAKRRVLDECNVFARLAKHIKQLSSEPPPKKVRHRIVNIQLDFESMVREE